MPYEKGVPGPAIPAAPWLGTGPARSSRRAPDVLRGECGIGTVVLIGNFVPRRCGIAAFTFDLHRALSQRLRRCLVVPVNDAFAPYSYPGEVKYEIEEQDLDSYRRAADFINSSGADVVSVQHEFGIYGGEAGSHLISLLTELRAPVVPTLHTILDKPNHAQRSVMESLIGISTRLVSS